MSLYRAGEYANAGVPMLPVVAGARETKRQMLIYTLVLWPVTRGALAAGRRRAVYGVGRAGAERCCSPRRRCASGSMPGDRSARQMFAFSLLYLFLIFALLLVDRTARTRGCR